MSSRDLDDVTCRQVEPLLDDLADGQLGSAEQTLLRRHLAACESCAAQLASLEDLLERTAALPRAVAPGHDLWPEVAPRLSARPLDPAAGRWPSWLRQAMAALLFMALGAALSQVLMPGGEAPALDLAAAPALESSYRQADFALAEADYLRAKEALWAAVDHGRHGVSEETREVVERHLRVIDQAIGELRHALAADPGNQRLESLLLAQHRTEIDLLQRLRRATETS